MMHSPLPLLAFFDLGAGESMVIMLLVLVFFGGDKLPGFARGLGKLVREFKKASSGVEDEIRRAMAEPPPPPLQPNEIAPPSLPAITAESPVVTPGEPAPVELTQPEVPLPAEVPSAPVVGSGASAPLPAPAVDSPPPGPSDKAPGQTAA